MSMLMMNARAPAAALTISLAALLCAGEHAAAQRPARGRTVTMAQILAGVPDSAMRARWIAADRAGRVPPLDASVLPARPVEPRRRVVLYDTGRVQVPDHLPPGTVADVRVFVRAPADSVGGRLVVRGRSAGRISANLVEGQAPVQILYRLPGRGSQDLAIRDPGELSLAVRNEVERGSLRRETRVTERGRTVLFFLSDGSDEPYHREFAEPRLSVRQLPPGQDSVSPVAVTIHDERFVLRPGESRVVRDADGTLEVYLGPTLFTPPDRTALAEGDPYHVTLMVFRRAER